MTILNREEIENLRLQLLGTVVQPMKNKFVGKEEVIDLLALALIAGENLFLLGPPGTAKSALVRSMSSQIGGRVFDYLLTRFTEPNEILGPFDIRKLKEGELVTNTEGMLPEADFVFLDELLNANSAILNSLLMVLNERVLRRGRQTMNLPTLIVIGASNRLPEEDALDALFDRFLLRVVCDCVPDEQLEEVLKAGWNLESKVGSREHGPKTGTMDVQSIKSLQESVLHVDLSSITKPFVDMIARLRRAGIPVSDRRAVKLQRVLAASALISGRWEANSTDFWVLRHIWDSVAQKEVLDTVVDKYLSKATEDQKSSAHPASCDSREPNPESLSSSLDEIELKINRPEFLSTDIPFYIDQVTLLKQKSAWVSNQDQRIFLEQKSESLLKKLQH